MEENKKSNKGLIITIVCLIVLLVMLIGYVVSERVLSDRLSKNNSNGNNTSESTTTIKSQKNESDNKTLGVPITNLGSNLDISLKRLEEGQYAILIDDKTVYATEEMVCSLPSDIVLLDNEYFLVISEGCAEGSYGYVFDKNGQKTNNMSDFIDLNINLYNISLEGNSIRGLALGYGPDYEFAACRYKPDEVVYGEVEFTYDGDGKFSTSMSNTATSDEVVHKKYGMSCEEIKNSTSNELKYERENIKEYDNN